MEIKLQSAVQFHTKRQAESVASVVQGELVEAECGGYYEVQADGRRMTLLDYLKLCKRLEKE